MTRYRLFYHFVWATKGRLPLLRGALRDAVRGAVAAKVQELRGVVHALDGTEDHLHLVATVPPSVAPSQLMAQVKDSSSHLASQLLTAVHSDGAFAWQAEYGVISVSERHLPLVIDYVRNQQHRHATNDLNSTLEAIE